MTTEVTFTGESGATWRYWTDRPLGIPGTFGAVYEAESKDGTPMAVKIVTKQRPFWTLDERLLRREIDIGRQVSESGSVMLLPVIDAADDGTALLLVMPRAGEPLAAVTMPMSDPEAIGVMTDIATGLQIFTPPGSSTATSSQPTSCATTGAGSSRTSESKRHTHSDSLPAAGLALL